MSADISAFHVEEHGRSVDAAVHLYQRVHDSDDISIGEPAAEGFSYRYRAVGDESLALGTSAVAAHRWGRVEPGRQYFLAWTTSPGVVLDVDGPDPIAMQPGVPVMCPAGRPFRFDAMPATQHLVRFDGDFLESVAAARRDAARAPLAFRRDVPADAVHVLRATIATAATTLLDPLTARATRTRWNVAVAEAVVDAFDAAPASSYRDAGSAVVRRAQEFIVASTADSVTIGMIASEAGVSVRTLQAAFRRHLGTTPLSFLRESRLHRARARLLTLGPGTTTVAEQALAQGFRHMGRFSAAYAEQFGEAPSETLRRRRLL